jgi:hypothetical protein
MLRADKIGRIYDLYSGFISAGTERGVKGDPEDAALSHGNDISRCLCKG